MKDNDIKYCDQCGTKLVMKECKGEPMPVPYCEKCGEYRFPHFNVAVCAAIFNSDYSKIMMMRQYGRDRYNHLAGYVSKGEEAESAMVREMKEEMNMVPASMSYLYSVYFKKSNTLMLYYEVTVDNESLDGMSKDEVDDARWFDYDDALRHVILGSLAERLLKYERGRFSGENKSISNTETKTKTFYLQSRQRGCHLITNEIITQIGELPSEGMLSLFVHHTSAALTINENADPDVRRDFESILNHTFKENESYYLHNDEGPDDMPAHIKSSVIGCSVNIPIQNGRLMLGTWQGIYLCEFRNNGGRRMVTAVIIGK